jgi:serine/threonine protein kinase
VSDEMERDRWTAARALFDRALALPEAERATFVEANAGHDSELRAEVLSLFGALTDAGGFLSGTNVGALDLDRDRQEEEVTRERIGPWRIADTLGRGGMGVVYLGERATGDYEQRVAIKVVSGGAENPAIVRRFQTERRILAALEHPAIARLVDGGTTEDGLPYFVMEYVEGKTLLAYADEKRLDLRSRIELFLEVCAAVEHAHQRLVLHRDLKPSNILVDASGRPRLLDFGIGKLVQPGAGEATPAETVTIDRWMTPHYASPEQILGQPTTTATDVYGLGVVLFELLTGAKPYRFAGTSLRDVEAAILEQGPRRLSTVVEESPARAAAMSEPSPARPTGCTPRPEDDARSMIRPGFHSHSEHCRSSRTAIPHRRPPYPSMREMQVRRAGRSFPSPTWAITPGKDELSTATTVPPATVMLPPWNRSHG